MSLEVSKVSQLMEYEKDVMHFSQYSCLVNCLLVYYAVCVLLFYVETYTVNLFSKIIFFSVFFFLEILLHISTTIIH